MSSESCHKYSTVSIQISDSPIDLLYDDTYYDDNDGYITTTINNNNNDNNNNKLPCDKVTLAGIARRGAMVDVGAIMISCDIQELELNAYSLALSCEKIFFVVVKMC
ncbi:Inactive dipeptidyl peptidase 10 [Schistosoma japonicum]|nr:Inactive dipeptidyl peptidase 10 [Schistosoma japonicum]